MTIKNHLTLLNNLILTELKLRYRSSAIGFFWVLLEPLLIALTLLIVFTQLFTNDLNNFPAYLLTGFIAWFFLADTTSALTVLVERKELIKKIKLPKELIILSKCTVLFIENLARFTILILVLLLVLKVELTLNFLMLPVLFVIQFIFILGCLTILSVAYVFLRDLSKIWAVAIQVWFFLTPIVYPQSLLTTKNYILPTLNPMLHFINAYRTILVYGKNLDLNALLILSFISLTVFIIGEKVFKTLEPRVVEEV